MRTPNRLMIVGLMMVLSGCLQSKEQLVIESNGSGTLETHLIVPQGTIQMIDTTLGGMMKAMTPQAADGSKPQLPASLAEQMFGNKDEILKKADKSGVKIEFVNFTSQKEADGLHVDYKITFDDINRLLKSNIVTTKIDLEKKGDGVWICRLPKGKQGEEESKAKIQQMEQFRNSQEFAQMDGVMKQMMSAAMSNFKMEFLISFPYPIVTVSGFEKVDDRTARLSFSADLMADPNALEKMYKQSAGGVVVWNVTGKPVPDAVESVTASPVSTPVEKPTVKQRQFFSGDSVRARLTNGTVYDGKMIEQTAKYIRIDAFGVPITLYNDELAGLDPAPR